MDLSTNNRAYAGMFEGCSSLRDAIDLPASSTIASFAYDRMFIGCNSMSGIVDIAATSFVAGAMNQMFWDNSSRDYGVRVHFDTWNQDVHPNWFSNGGYATNIFYCPADLPEERGNNRIPKNWTIVRE